MHLVKGRLSPAVRRLAGLSHPVRIVDVPRPLFWPVAFGLVTAWGVSGRLRTVLVDNERSQRRLGIWSRMARVRITLLREGAQGDELWQDGRLVPREAWRETLLRP